MERPLVTLDPQQRQEAGEFVRALTRQEGALARERSRHVDRIKAELAMAADRAREIDRGLFPEEDVVVWDRQHPNGFVQRVPLLSVPNEGSGLSPNCMVFVDFKGMLHPNYMRRVIDGTWCWDLHYPDQTEDYYYLAYGEKVLEAIAQRVRSHLPQETPA